MNYDIEKAKTLSGTMSTTPTKLTPSELLTGLPSNVTPQASREKQERMKIKEDLKANLADRLKVMTNKIKSKQLEIDNEARGKNNPLKLNRLNQDMNQLRSEAGRVKTEVIAESGIKERQTANLAGQQKPQQTQQKPQQKPQQTQPKPIQQQTQQQKPLPKPIRRPVGTSSKPDKRTQFRDVKNTTTLSTTPDMTPKKTIRRKKVKRSPTGNILYPEGTPAKVQKIPQENIKSDKQPKQMSRRVKEVLQRGKKQGGIALRNPNEPRTTRIRRKNPNEPRTGRIRRKTQ